MLAFVSICVALLTLQQVTATEPTCDQLTEFEYHDALGKSFLFYEAQRASNFPRGHHKLVPFRAEAALNDGADNGMNLTGGWFDAGDYVKFGLPMAWSATTLLWAAIDHWKGIGKNSLGSKFKTMIRAPLDYFMQAHPEPKVLYVQVGDGGKDHSFWGRPENMQMERPSYAVTEDCPGTDVVAETAAAMAAGSLFFQGHDSNYSAALLTHAVDLFDFAWADGDVTKRGVYQNCVPAAANFYSSSGYNDELVWSALWLYRATEDPAYLEKALNDTILKYKAKDYAFSWNNKMAGYQLLLFQVTNEEEYTIGLKKFIKYWFPSNYHGLADAGGLPYTPDGIGYRSQWGALRYTAAAAFLDLHAHSLGIMVDDTFDWGLEQIDHILGKNINNRSYVVGFGHNPPERPHHRSSDCPPPTEANCTWAHYGYGTPNYYTLYGALVGGPRIDGVYEDDRTNYVHNEVACDYNAGFTAALIVIEDKRWQSECL